MSFRINAMMMSMPLDSWVAMQFCNKKKKKYIWQNTFNMGRKYAHEWWKDNILWLF